MRNNSSKGRGSRRTKAQLSEENDSLRRRVRELEQGHQGLGKGKRPDQLSEAVQRIYKEIPFGFCHLDTDLRYWHINDWLAALNGLSVEDHLGRSIGEVIPHVAAGVEAQLRHVIESGKPILGETVDAETPAQPGVTRSFQHSYLPTRSDDGTVVGVSCIVEEITERKKTEKALHESEERLRHIVDTSPFGVSIVSRANRKRLYVNRHFVEMLGGGSDENILKWPAAESYSDPAKREQNWAAFERDGILTSTEEERKSLDGTTWWCLADWRPTVFEGKEAVINWHYDITERKHVQEALLTAKGEAENANRSKSEFLASMSHDLRTPLNAILGFSDILSGQHFGPISDKYQEYATDIHSSGEHLLELVNDILDLTTIEAGKQSLVKEKLSTMEIVTECERIIEDKARSHGIDLITEIPKDLPPLYADKRAVKQILLNLLSNAVKFTPEGGRITVSAKASKRNTTLKITDTGKGIPAEKLPKLTDPFTKAGLDPYLAEEGWGLGLSITNALVDLHDGKLDIKSKIGKGTTVTVTFPNEAP